MNNIKKLQFINQLSRITELVLLSSMVAVYFGEKILNYKSLELMALQLFLAAPFVALFSIGTRLVSEQTQPIKIRAFISVIWIILLTSLMFQHLLGST